MSPNMKAFLDTIAWSEIGAAMLAVSDNGYNVLVGSTPAKVLLFHDYSVHPRIRSDMGTPNNPNDDSDAAGRYQFMGRYWAAYKTQLGLLDFGPASQDRWCVQLIRECHAIDDIEAGRFRAAVTKCRSRWASFPGAGYGQHENEMAALEAVYLRSGGRLS